MSATLASVWSPIGALHGSDCAIVVNGSNGLTLSQSMLDYDE